MLCEIFMMPFHACYDILWIASTHGRVKKKYFCTMKLINYSLWILYSFFPCSCNIFLWIVAFYKWKCLQTNFAKLFFAFFKEFRCLENLLNLKADIIFKKMVRTRMDCNQIKNETVDELVRSSLTIHCDNSNIKSLIN